MEHLKLMRPKHMVMEASLWLAILKMVLTQTLQTFFSQPVSKKLKQVMPVNQIDILFKKELAIGTG